jgi:hypothetical protein
MKTINQSINPILAAACLIAAVAAPAWAQSPDVALGADDAEFAAQSHWRTYMAQNPASEAGCFHASYPNTVWEKEDCKIVAAPPFHPVRAKSADGAPEVVGNINDYVAKAKGLITQTSGGFQVDGVTSETGVGVKGFGGHGILGPNEYSLQINTNANETTSACDHHSGCTVWQQYLYSPDYVEKGKAAVYIQYWLLGWGSSACPTTGSWNKDGKDGDGNDCFMNSAIKTAPDLPITDLGKMSLLATADPGGLDSVSFSFGTESHSVTASDNVLDISSVWKESEFNVVGNTDGSRADFNSGSSITVTLILFDGSDSAPTCVADSGTTGESNNLTLGSCNAFSGLFPNIVFTESN